ncbi:MAG: transporter substrate-binding domain-containing protein [Thermodesulfobacteriota bacterium]
MHRVWVGALLPCVFCLVIGLVVFSQGSWSETKQSSLLHSTSSVTSGGLDPRVSAQGTLEAIRSRGELRVGMQTGYMPFQIPDSDGQAIGLDVDVASMVAQALGVRLRIVRQDNRELMPSLLRGKIDVIMSAWSITPERNAQVVFTRPVLDTGRMFAVHREYAESFQQLNHLNREGLLLVSGPSGYGNLKAEQALPLAACRELPDSRSALDEVVQGRAHAYVDEEFAVRMACARYPELLVGRFEPFTYEPIAWAIRPSDNHWLNWLNNFIDMMRHDGTLEALHKKWRNISPEEMGISIALLNGNR